LPAPASADFPDAGLVPLGRCDVFFVFTAIPFMSEAFP
jgi:hypothetical protein